MKILFFLLIPALLFSQTMIYSQYDLAAKSKAHFVTIQDTVESDSFNVVFSTPATKYLFMNITFLSDSSIVEFGKITPDSDTGTDLKLNNRKLFSADSSSVVSNNDVISRVSINATLDDFDKISEGYKSYDSGILYLDKSEIYGIIIRCDGIFNLKIELWEL